ncbi:hypothetical protein BT63DRAFT_418411 [Microthyrium microscopicum]|uniref:Uncharacterized protein n=1 Tax=Microthyrium microscopicum TaxID=703497 RepID=A0A6A6TW51_9PEZI|nr:hypothetical protein BT63DRAFT_418411 [Microthyrium microscopicum]
MFFQTAFIGLSCLTSTAFAKGLSGSYERVYFCEAYLILNTIEGNTQNVILPIPQQRGGLQPSRSGPGNTFTFQECIDNVSDVYPYRCQIEGPREGRDVEVVANELKAAGYVNLFKPRKINYRLLKTGNVYLKLVELVHQSMEKALQTPQSEWKGPAQNINYDVAEKAKNMQDCGKAIKYLRNGEFYSYMRNDLTREEAQNGFGLPEDNIKTIPEDNKLDPEDPFNKVNTDTTIKANPDVFDSRTKRNLFRKWVKGYGEGKWEEKYFPKYQPATISHYEVKEAWKISWQAMVKHNEGGVCK